MINYYNKFKTLTRIVSFLRQLSILLLLITTVSCAVPEFAKPSKTTTDPSLSAKEKARKNIEEGRGVSLKGIVGGRNSTNYEFSTSTCSCFTFFTEIIFSTKILL